MTIVIVEGCDGAGKTTLINKLQKDLNLITIKSPRPVDYQDCKDLLARTMLLAENTNIICDRIGIISEPIYGPICRNTLGFPPMSETEKILQLMNPIIIYCNPPVEFCEKNVETHSQMLGVKEHLRSLHEAYREWFSEMGLCSVYILPYDYTEDSYDELLSEVECQLEERHAHPPDREMAAVQAFHEKFGVAGHQLTSPGLMDRETFEFRKKFLFEEVQEFCDAYEAGDVVTMFDSLIDLVYVAKGSGLFMGVSSTHWALGWDIVHNANVAKMRAPTASDSKRGSALDVIKPPGWQKPEPKLASILGVEYKK